MYLLVVLFNKLSAVAYKEESNHAKKQNKTDALFHFLETFNNVDAVLTLSQFIIRELDYNKKRTDQP